MGTCSYCGDPAGLFRKQHAECEEIASRGRERIINAAVAALRDEQDFGALVSTLTQLEEEHRVPNSERKGLLVRAWQRVVNEYLEDRLLEQAEEHKLGRFREAFGLSQGELDQGGSFMKVAKAAVLRDVLSGSVPKRVTLDGGPAINLQKGEQIVWAYPNSEYLEDKVRRQYIGGSQGVSVRIMRGVYYRVGAFKGNVAETVERTHVDTGCTVITNRNIYFAGASRSVRVPYQKIISFEPFKDGIGVTRDAASARPQIFVTGDGWFTYNLVTNLAKL